MSDIDAIKHDVAALYKFISSVSDLCPRETEYPSYLEASDTLFKHLRDIGDATKSYLEGFISSLAVNSSTALNADRQKLSTLRFAWFKLHEHVRPAVDAHSLNIPWSLIAALVSRFKRLPGMSTKQFAVLHTDTLNYFEAHGMLRDRVEKLQAIVPGSPPFPANLGVIEFPYSQANSVFLNCLIAHEMGHFLFGELDQSKLQNIEHAVQHNIKVQYGSTYGTMAQTDLIWSSRLIFSWVEELFCDLFAITLVGPAFVLAYVDIFDISVRLYPSGGSFNTLFASPNFRISHPATLFRLREHVNWLKELGWWNSVREFKTHFVDVLKQAEPMADIDFSFDPTLPRPQEGRKMVTAFMSVIEPVRELLRDISSGINNGRADFEADHVLIEEYLRHGVVPSTVVGNLGSQRFTHPFRLKTTPEPRHPSFVAIVNAAYKFYLESMPTLIGKIDVGNVDSVSDRAKWMGKLESWTMKAIEDQQLLSPGQN